MRGFSIPNTMGMWRDFDPVKALLGRYNMQGTVDGNWSLRASGKAGNWVTTLTGSTPTWLLSQTSPQALVQTGVAADGAGINAQWCTDGIAGVGTVSEAFKLDATGKPLWFEWYGKQDTLRTRQNLGICITGTTLVAGMTDGLYFRLKDNDANIYLVAEKDSVETEVDTTADIAANTYIRLGFYVPASKDRVEVWVDGVQVYTLEDLTNLPNDEELALSMAFLEGNDNAAVVTCRSIQAWQDPGV